jgi:hypothetical protein
MRRQQFLEKRTDLDEVDGVPDLNIESGSQHPTRDICKICRSIRPIKYDYTYLGTQVFSSAKVVVVIKGNQLTCRSRKNPSLGVEGPRLESAF